MTQNKDAITSQLPALQRFALALTRDQSEAEDLVQEALLRGHARRRSFRPDGNLKSWLFSILKNAFIDQNRSRRAEALREAEHAAHAPLSMDAPQEAAVRLAQLRAAFMALPQDQREALTLVALEGMTYAEAAEVAGIAMGTLMSRVARARAALREFEAGTVAAPAPQPATKPAPHSPRVLRLVGGPHAD